MDTNILKHFAVNYKEIIIDEIALEGLEGTGFDLLWRRIGKRISSDVTEKIKVRFWRYIVNCGRITFYQLPEPLPYVEILDRFTIIDEGSGHLMEPVSLNLHYVNNIFYVTIALVKVMYSVSNNIINMALFIFRK